MPRTWAGVMADPNAATYHQGLDDTPGTAPDVTALLATLIANPTTPTRFIAGSDALPGLTPLGDPNTGITSPGGDQLALVTNGGQRVLLTTTLLSTSVPLQAGDRLFVRGGGGSFVAEAGGYTLQVQGAGDASIKIQAAAGSSAYLGMGTNADGLAAGLSLNTTTGLLNVRAGNGNRISVTSGGDIGIGTSTPTAKLQVVGSIRHNTHAFNTLPSASAVGAGTRLMIVDSPVSPVFGAAAAGGGSLSVPVYSDGTIWRNG